MRLRADGRPRRPAARRRTAVALSAILGLSVAASLFSVALADTLLTPAPGARHLAQGGGYIAWSAPVGDGRFRLMVRAPGGQVRALGGVAAFGAAPDLEIGSDRYGIAGRRLLLVYSRCRGASVSRGCDVYAYDLRRGREERVAALSTRSYSETAPALYYGRYGFVRRGGRRPGTYSHTPNGGSVRLSARVADDLAVAPRIVYSVGRTIVLRPLSGRGSSFVYRVAAVPRDLYLTRYRFGFLSFGGRVFETVRFAGSGGRDYAVTPREGRRLPPSTSAIAGDSSGLHTYLDDAGVSTVDPSPFASRRAASDGWHDPGP